MSHLCKKEQRCTQIEAELNRHKRARQLSIFEINRIKAATRRMRPNFAPFGPAIKWLNMVRIQVLLLIESKILNLKC